MNQIDNQERDCPCVNGVLIGDDMGLGKTIQAIGIINSIGEIAKAMIVCPASVKRNWERELNKWLTRRMDVAIAHGSEWPGLADIVIINYDILGRNLDSILANKWDLIVLDECHSIKNMATKRYKAVAKANARFRVAMTGTPIMNKIEDIFPVLHWLRPDLFSNPMSFKRKFTDRFGNSTKEQRTLLQSRLRESVMVRRLKGEVLKELPQKQRQVIEIDPPAHVVQAEQSAMKCQDEDELASLEVALELAKVSDKPEDYANALSNLRKGQQIAFDSTAKVRHDTAIAKAPFTLEHIYACLEQGIEKLLIWFHHRDCGEFLLDSLKGQAVMVYGGMDMDQRERAREKFITDPNCKVWMGSIRATGTGIDGLQQVCQHAIFHELDWVPMIMTQAEDRIHRIGQDGHVLIQLLVFSGTIDANIARACVNKQELADQCLDEERDQLLTEPVSPTRIREKRSHLTVTRKEIEERVLEPGMIVSIHQSLRMLAGICDGAHSLDGAGFSKFDAHLGKRLAELATLTSGQAQLGQKLVRRYRRQLPEDLALRALGRNNEA